MQGGTRNNLTLLIARQTKKIENPCSAALDVVLSLIPTLEGEHI